MDNSSTSIGTEKLQAFRSPPRRRRSTFFERRESIAPNTKTNNVNSDTEESDGRSEFMNKYYQELFSEKEAWKKAVTERRNKYHDLKEQCQLVASSRSSMSYSVLTDEDIKFLKAKPNISKLIEAQQKLHRSVLQTRELYKRMNELDNVILQHSEEIVNKVNDYILENSSVETVE